MRGPSAYETIGCGYTGRRRPDPRIARRIAAAIGEATLVVNVGAGAGSYEPADRTVVAVEPSDVMLAQRPAGAAPAVRAVAESLPFSDDRFDVAMALLTVHHWSDVECGLAELRRVARRQVVFGFDPERQLDLWFTAEYVPASAAMEQGRAPSTDELSEWLGGATVEAVPIPHDCSDGFLGAYWRRPEAYLDPDVRASISSIAQLDPSDVEPGIERLAGDLESGAWHERHGALLEVDELDLGYWLLVAG
ncbi:MAG: methyltransferase domain-containing protein [Acidimicrobiia bacterium]|nr:methyltransferase domain-containing protein [Acidimicrobiia bacterium]